MLDLKYCGLYFPGPSFLQDPPGAVGSFSAPGDQVNRPSRSETDRSILFFLHVFLLGFLVEETPCEHRENMQTPHRKARGIAHLRSEEDLPPRANSAPCGNRTHDLLALRLQCKHLSHRAIYWLLLEMYLTVKTSLHFM